MTNTLRDEVEALASEWACAASRGSNTLLRAESVASYLRESLSRHPDPGDSAVVPRELLVRFRQDSQMLSDIMARVPNHLAPDRSADLAQADAILGKREG